MPVLYTTVRASGKDFNYVRVSIYKDAVEQYLVHQPDVYFWTTERSNLLKVIKRFVFALRESEQIGENRKRYFISEQDVEMIKLLHQNQKKYPVMRRLLKAKTRQDVVLELEIENISDAILRLEDYNGRSQSYY